MANPKYRKQSFSMVFDQAIREDLQFIGQHCRAVRSNAAIIRGAVQRHAELLRKQLKYEKQDKELVYSAVGDDGEYMLLGELDMKKL